MRVSLNMLPTHLGAPCGDVPREKSIHLATSELHVRYTHAGVRQFYFNPGFCSQNNYLPWDRKGYESFNSIIDPTTIIHIWIFTQIQKRADMTSRLSGSGLSDCPSSPVRAKVECCESHDLFSCQVTDCSATRIPSSSLMGRHPWPTGSLVGGGVTPLQRCNRRILQPQLTGQKIKFCKNKIYTRQRGQKKISYILDLIKVDSFFLFISFSIPYSLNTNLVKTFFGFFFLKAYQPQGLLNAKDTLIEEQWWDYATHGWVDKRVYSFSKGISPKVNVKVWLEFEWTPRSQFGTLAITSQGLPLLLRRKDLARNLAGN